MGYRNKVYVSFDADTDMKYYGLLKAWNENENIDFCFYDAHDVNTILDKSEESIKSGLQERFRDTKIFILLVGEKTKYLYKYVRWEIEQAINRKIPCIVINLNGKRHVDDEKCPPIIKNELSIHIAFEKNIIRYAIDNWPNKHYEKLKQGDTNSYYYVDSVYESMKND